MPQNTLAADGTLSSCRDVFEFPLKKLKEREGESLALKLELKFRVLN